MFAYAFSNSVRFPSPLLVLRPSSSLLFEDITLLYDRIYFVLFVKETVDHCLGSSSRKKVVPPTSWHTIRKKLPIFGSIYQMMTIRIHCRGKDDSI